ncbi:uncharacterized protein FPOAC1_013237 [Fusarium poae]|uniref:uncharacterized protein n=1 Tax=Fusarium poae TaxID=36050 RepID=UPI001D05669E|nr:uncharacterized protein FPOAC1_013237 [Fusarium poae]KAG8665258.1 hypothetical protein FPOAC1_013237 [Fusarium poae]
MSNSPLSPSPAGFPPTTLTPCPTPPSSVFSRLSQPKTVAKQLEEAAVGALPPNPTIENLSKITWKNRRFVQEDLLARKGAKGRKSWIRSHGTFLVELNYQDLPIGHVWCCNRCDMRGAAEFFSVQATSSAADHLRKAHRITPASQSSDEVTEETMGETQVDAAEQIATASANFRESNGRPSRVRRLPARFEEDEVYALPQRSQPPRFVESALPLHSRADYSTAEKRSASETSQKSTLRADHRAYIRASINNGWKKLNEYYDKLGESPLFAAAIILHPRFGISWLEATWVSEEQTRLGTVRGNNEVRRSANDDGSRG